MGPKVNSIYFELAKNIIFFNNEVVGLLKIYSLIRSQ